MLKKLLLLGAIVYTILLIIISLISIDHPPSLGSEFDDKIYHVIAYIILSFLWMLYFKPYKTKYLPIIIFLAVVLFGYVIEILQHLLNPSRTYDTFDLMANTIGAVIGTLIVVNFSVLKLK